MHQFKIYYNDKVVGQALLEKQGMFYRVHCQCSLPENTAFRVQMTSEHKNLDLGICTRMDKGIGMIARIPACDINEMDAKFSVIAEEWENISEVSEHCPFQSIDKLTSARFIRREGKAYISF